MKFKNVMEYDPQIAFNFIAEHEGLKLTAYLCPAGKWTIGYGHTAGVRQGDKISQQLADEYLREDLRRTQEDLYRLANRPITEGMFIALMSFVYNFGITKCRGYSLFDELNKYNYGTTSDWFPKYRYSGKTELAGLVKRRLDERQEFRRGFLE